MTTKKVLKLINWDHLSNWILTSRPWSSSSDGAPVDMPLDESSSNADSNLMVSIAGVEAIDWNELAAWLANGKYEMTVGAFGFDLSCLPLSVNTSWGFCFQMFCRACEQICVVHVWMIDMEASEQ